MRNVFVNLHKIIGEPFAGQGGNFSPAGNKICGVAFENKVFEICVVERDVVVDAKNQIVGNQREESQNPRVFRFAAVNLHMNFRVVVVKRFVAKNNQLAINSETAQKIQSLNQRGTKFFRIAYKRGNCYLNQN